MPRTQLEPSSSKRGGRHKPIRVSLLNIPHIPNDGLVPV